MLKKWQKAFILISLGSMGFLGFVPLLHAQEAESNLEFIEATIEAFADSLFRTDPFERIDGLIIRVQSIAAPEGAATFVQKVLTTVAAQTARVRLDNGSQTDLPENNDLLMSITIEGWTLSVAKSEADQSRYKFRQVFETVLRIFVTDRSKVVRYATRRKITGSRPIVDETTLLRIQDRQPEFARFDMEPVLSKSDFFQTFLIALATALTIFLIYQFRSQ